MSERERNLGAGKSDEVRNHSDIRQGIAERGHSELAL